MSTLGNSADLYSLFGLSQRCQPMTAQAHIDMRTRGHLSKCNLEFTIAAQCNGDMRIGSEDQVTDGCRCSDHWFARMINVSRTAAWREGDDRSPKPDCGVATREEEVCAGRKKPQRNEGRAAQQGLSSACIETCTNLELATVLVRHFRQPAGQGGPNMQIARAAPCPIADGSPTLPPVNGTSLSLLFC